MPTLAEALGDVPIAPEHPEPIASNDPENLSAGEATTESHPPEAEPVAATNAADDSPEPIGGAARSFPPPRLNRMSPELQREIDDALGGLSLDDILLGKSNPRQDSPEPELEQRLKATVVKIHRENVFFDLPGRYEAVAPLRNFDEPPEIGATLDVVVQKYSREDGLYEVSIPGASISVGDWSDIQEGAIVEARVSGHNSGGLECEVNHLRGFIPVSQISMYRVEDLEQFVGEKFACVVTECNPARRNLVLSRRAVLEREKADAKEKLVQSLAVGQVHEGVVRSLRDFGAFVDLGGIDGLIHISKMSWDRVRHPSEVLEEGQKVKVKIERIDETTGKLSLSLRDLAEHPWQNVANRFVVGEVVTGTVSKVMDFGAFVRLDAGVEGLVHISELAHHRVNRVDQVVKEGDSVDVKILSIDPEQQRMSLSIKAASAAPQTAASGTSAEPDVEEPTREKVTKTFSGKLKGGTDRPSGGEQFGLKW